MGDKCNCYRFSPRDSLSGAVAQIADYLSKHPGWNETELRAFVDGLISSAGVETFNGRSGNVTLNKDDVNNLLIANCYFAEADETIESIDVLTLYKLGIRIIFTQYSSEVGGYTLAYGIEYYPATDTAKAYLFSGGSGGGTGAIVSVNGKTGVVVLKASDILMNNGDSVEYAVSSAKVIANAAYSPDNPPPYPVTSVNGKTGAVTGLYDKNNPPPYPVNGVNSKTGSVMLKVVDVSNGNSTDENAYIFIDESDDYPDVIASDSSKLGGQLPSYYAPAEDVSKLNKITHGTIEITDLIMQSEYNHLSLEKVGNIVQLVFDATLDKSKNFVIYNSNLIAKLPINFRPAYGLYVSVSMRNGVWAYFVVSPNGDIAIQPFAAIEDASTFGVSLTYIAKEEV